ncbi:CP4-57 prophage; protein YfjQ [Paraburkholderia tropica]|uniref:DUF932 domain-containing protein n=1 Tax=Paraburkholderia tropica TaxID=92647 RepID=UPI001CB0151B|nr:DUF932 domain-containing protein [Paraburkholderia tropica]CAG9235848.1 CP4-57 prophage; protein YfjQ [Paraburkholderia tropica]
MQKLASKFGRNAHELRSSYPLSDDEMRGVAPSIFALEPHESRSEKYSYIPTIDVLSKLRKEGFEPFMVAQTRVRDASNAGYTKHMIRMRHANQIAGNDANEVILLNSHNGASSYQMLAGCFRGVCKNGMVVGTVQNDIRIPHKGDVAHNVIEGAIRVLDSFEAVDEQREGMKSLRLSEAEQMAYASAALAARYETEDGQAPINERQLLSVRRWEDNAPDLWTTFNRVQENVIRGGLQGRNAAGRRTTTRAVTGIDQDVKLNRALWILAERMREIKG